MKANHTCVDWAVAAAVALSAGLAWGADADTEFDAAIKALITVSQDADVEVRIAALNVLAGLPRCEAIADAVRDRLQDEDKDVRQTALAGLVKLEGGTDEVLGLLVDGLDDPVVAGVARDSLLKLGVRAVPALVEAVNDETTRRQAVQLLGMIEVGEHRAKAVAALTTALKDESKAIRLEATHSLGKILKDTRRNKDIDPRYMQYFEQVFKKYDANTDGALTEDEWAKMSKNPEAADANCDARVTVEEYANWALQRQGLR